MLRKVKLIPQEVTNRCKNLDGHAIKEAIDILVANAQLSLNKTKDDHRFHQGNLQALEAVYDLITKP